MKSHPRAKAERELRVRCRDCGHVWTALYLPQQMTIAAKVLLALHCPKCGVDSQHITCQPEEAKR